MVLRASAALGCNQPASAGRSPRCAVRLEGLPPYSRPRTTLGLHTVEGDDRICGRCYDEDVKTFPANCDERPETQGNLGMYHCPDCGAMILGGLAHPWLCRPCLDRAHPFFDRTE